MRKVAQKVIEFIKKCRAAGKQRHTTGAAIDGCTKTLSNLLTQLRNEFEESNVDQKKSLGMSKKKAGDITHYDLLEIGLIGKINTNEKSASAIYLRNQNLKYIYSEQHRNFLSKYYDKSTKDSTDDLAEPTLGEKLYCTKVTKGADGFGETLAQNPDCYFINQMKRAIKEYGGAEQGCFKRKTKQSTDISKQIQNILREGKNDSENCNSIYNVLCENDFGPKSPLDIKKVFIKHGFLDVNGKPTMLKTETSERNTPTSSPSKRSI